jgi:uncharacterized protein (TIGR03437 family)
MTILRYWILLAAAAAWAQGPAGVLSTVAGNGVAGFSGDGGPAVNASLAFAPTRQEPGQPDINEFDQFMHLAVDPAGNLYIADNGNHRIRKVTPGGIITTVAGNGARGFGGDMGPAVRASLYGPAAVAVDPRDGSLYIADEQNNRIRHVAPDGMIHTVAGDGRHLFYTAGQAATASPMDWPSAVVFDAAAGVLYFAESHSNRVGKIVDGRLVTVAGDGFEGLSGDGGPALAARMRLPAGLAMDGRGNLYVVDQRNHRVRRIAPDGTITTVAGSGNGHMSAGYGGDGGPATSAQMNHPSAVAVDAAGNIYIADMMNHRVRRVTPDGRIATVAGNGRPGYGGDGGPGPAGQLNFPAGLALDAAGNLYIADWQNFRVRKLAFSPVVSSVTNGASFAPADVVGIAPGSWISIFGSALASGEAAASAIPLPRALASASVRINGTPVPLSYVSPTQINAQAPVDLAPGAATLTVSNAGVETAAVRILVAAAGPGVFTYGQNRAVATHADGTLITAESPAAPGETIIVYLSGVGAVTPQPATGEAAGAAPLSQAAAPCSVTIGGREAVVDFVGMTPFLVGLAQANIRVPAGAASGDQPVVITVGGAVSNAPVVRIR